MGGSRSLTIALATGLGLMAALGAPAETTPPPAQPQPQPQQQPPQQQAQPQAPPRPQAAQPEQPKVAAVEYLKAGAALFNKGDVARATRYFEAAERFRSQLSQNEQVVLDVYQEEVAKYQKRLTGSRIDPAVAPASMRAQPPASATTDPPAQPKPEGPAASLRGNAPSRYETTDQKARARWLIQEAREQMALGHLDEAERKLIEAQAMDATWGRLENSPDKLAKVLAKARAKASKSGSTTPPSARPLGLHPDDANASPAQP